MSVNLVSAAFLASLFLVATVSCQTCNPSGSSSAFVACINSAINDQLSTTLGQFDPLILPDVTQNVNGFTVAATNIRLTGLSTFSPTVSSSMPTSTSLQIGANVKWTRLSGSLSLLISKTIFGIAVPLFKATPTITVTDPSGDVSVTATISSSGATVTSTTVSLTNGSLTAAIYPGGIWFLFHLLMLFLPDKILTNLLNTAWNDNVATLQATLTPIVMTAASAALTTAFG